MTGGSPSSRSRRALLVVPGVLVAVGIVVALSVQLLRTPPTPRLTGLLAGSLQVPPPAGGGIKWPSTGAADLSVPGVVSFDPHGTTSPVPIASITKVMTTLVLLRDHPLATGQQGPSIPVDAAEVARYHADVANGDSVVPVAAGEQLSEYQAIEAMLVPSADDVAQIVAQWDAGGEPAFVDQMNALARAWGLDHTHFVDVSGVNPGSVSTSSNLLLLARRAMSSPVIRSVVALRTVDLPDSATPVPTYDYVLGQDGIIGIKTGSDTAAGGCFLFAADVTADGHTSVAYGDVLGQQSSTSIIDAALDESVDMLASLQRVLAGVTVVHRHEDVGTLVARDGDDVTVSAASSATVIADPGAALAVRLTPDRLPTGRVPEGTTVGSLTLRVGTETRHVPVVTDRTLPSPSTAWRIFHG